MKSMEYYIKSEAKNYQKIFADYQKLLNLLIQKYIKNETNYTAIVIFATGSSSNAAYGAVPFMTERLGIPVYVEEPSIAANYHSNFKENILYIAISQSGHSASTIKIVKELVAKKIDIFVITSDLRSPIAKTGAEIISMGIEIEEMSYVTLGYSVTVLLLILFAVEAAYKAKRINSTVYSKDREEIKQIITNLPEIVSLSEQWSSEYLKQNSETKRIYFIGYGAAYGVAREGETKITETVHITAQGMELEEYMHGPYIGLHSLDRFVFIEPQGKLENRAKKLQNFLNLHCDNISIINKNEGSNFKKNSLNLNTDVNELLAALFMTIPVHLLAFKLSQVNHIDLESPTYPEFDKITKSKI